jgi:hypothetical protein
MDVKKKKKLKSRKRGRKHCQTRKNQSGERKERMTFGSTATVGCTCMAVRLGVHLWQLG